MRGHFSKSLPHGILRHARTGFIVRGGWLCRCRFSSWWGLPFCCLGGESTFIGDDHHWRSGYNKVINAGLNRVNESRTAQGTQHPSPPTHHACRNHHDGTLCSPIYSGSLLYCTRMFVFIHLRDGLFSWTVVDSVGRLQTAVQSKSRGCVRGRPTDKRRSGGGQETGDKTSSMSHLL